MRKKRTEEIKAGRNSEQGFGDIFTPIEGFEAQKETYKMVESCIPSNRNYKYKIT